MKARVDPQVCTGCELCIATCPQVFESAGDVAAAKPGTVPSDAEESCRRAAEDCPVGAITVE